MEKPLFAATPGPTKPSTVEQAGEAGAEHSPGDGPLSLPLCLWAALPPLLAGVAIALALPFGGEGAREAVAATTVLAALGSFLAGRSLEQRMNRQIAALWALPMLAGSRRSARHHALRQFSDLVRELRTVLAFRQISEEKLATQARHDVLTGLANRALFGEKLATAAGDLHAGGGFSLLAIDLDRFKAVNDTFGHAMGDLLLGSVARRLQSCCRRDDVVARLGGDEFAVLLGGIAQPEDAANLAQRLVKTLSAPYVLDDKEVVIGASIGIALAPLDGTEPARLMEHADQALYRAKNEGRHGFRFFEPGIGQWAQAQLALREDLMPALIRHEFRLFFQPVVDLASGRIAACEAHLRWQHRTRGLVRAADFMSIAERSDAIEPLTEWMLGEACARAASWPDDVVLMVKIPPRLFTAAWLPRHLTQTLRHSGLPARRLELEVTETALFGTGPAAQVTIAAVKRLGVRVALERFGAGRSPFGYLRPFPFDEIKIDGSQIHGMAEDPQTRETVQATIRLGCHLGIGVVATGVATPEQIDFLRDNACPLAQGELLGAPLAAEEIDAQLDAFLLPAGTCAP